MAIIDKKPVYFSGFAPVLSLGANMGTNDCIVKLDNSNGVTIKNGCIITYDWNDPTNLIIQNGNSVKTITFNFYTNGPSGTSLLGDPKPYIKYSGGLTISSESLGLDKTTNIYYANNNCLVCEAMTGNFGSSSLDSNVDGVIGSIPTRNNSNYSNWYEDYILIQRTGTYKIRFTRTKMIGSFEITVNYKEWETEE